MGNRQTKVTLTAQVQGYVDGMEKAARATRETGSEAEKLAQKSAAFEQMGRASMVAGGAIAAGLVLSTKAAIDWDSAWAGVTKTVDGSPEQLAAVEEGLRGLTAVLPASHTEIAAVAEAAGQLGIKTPEVVEFTRTMIDLGETTNLTSEQAATSLARFMTVMGTAQGEVSGLGSALVALGNNYATTEAEIMEMSMRLAGAGNQIGMSEGQVLGLSTALSSVGIEAEAGGSAMSKVMIDIASSAEKGGERIAQFADVAGMSADEFTAKWKKDPGEALAAFVKGLANAEAQGKSTFGILEELGITEVRMRDALLRSASAADQFSEAMRTGNKAMEENGALTDEAEKRYETTAAQLDIMKNRVVDAAISFGEHFLPAVEAVADGVGDFADLLGGMEGPMGAVVAWGSLITAGILLTGGAALASVPKIAAYKVALETLGYSGSALQRGVRGIAGFLTGPWGVAMLAAGIAVRTFTVTMDASKVTAQELENSLKQGGNAYDDMSTKASENSNILWDNAHNIENLGEVLDKAATAGRGFWSSMSFGENAALDGLKEFGNVLAPMAATDLPKAQAAFKDFYETAGLDGKQALTAINEEMPGFKSALLDVAEASNIATDDATLLQLALGNIKPAAQDGTDGAEKQTVALEELQGVASKTSDEVSKLADEIRNFGSAQFDTEQASIAFHEALDGLRAQLDSGSASLDVTTEAGRKTRSQLLDVASSTNDLAAATLAQTGSQEEANAVLEQGRQRLIETMIQLGATEAEAKAYADQLIATPASVQTAIIANFDEVIRKGNEFHAMLNAIPGQKDVFINQVVRETGAPRGQVGAAYNEAGGMYVDGVKYFANGGIEPGTYQGGRTLYGFAEPGVPWEAFISGKPSERDRNRQIWAETGARLGLASSAGLGDGGTVNVSLAGATLRATIDGRPITLMIDEQITSALAPVSRGSQRLYGGV